MKRSADHGERAFADHADTACSARSYLGAVNEIDRVFAVKTAGAAVPLNDGAGNGKRITGVKRGMIADYVEAPLQGEIAGFCVHTVIAFGHQIKLARADHGKIERFGIDRISASVGGFVPAFFGIGIIQRESVRCGVELHRAVFKGRDRIFVRIGDPHAADPQVVFHRGVGSHRHDRQHDQQR